MKILALLQSRRNYFIGYLIFFITLSILILTYSKEESHLLMNSFHTPLLDQFFKNITHLGDGLTVALLGIVFLLLQVRKGIIFILSGALSGAFTQFLKRTIFNDHYRPTKFFNINFPNIELPLVEGVEMHSNFSFPSGHTTAAFAMMTAAALLSKNKKADIVFIIAGILISFSRVYLSQHFLEDILTGSFIGTFTAIIMYITFNGSKLKDVSWLNKKILPSKNGQK